MQDFLAELIVDDVTAVLAAMHQAADARSELADLLRSSVSVPVDWLTDGVQIAYGRVQVVPIGQSIDLTADGFRSSEGRKRTSKPFDELLIQAAQRFGDRASAGVLSGAGSDGTEGCMAVVAAGGRVYAQLPVGAEFPGMPQSVVSRGVVQLMGSPRTLAEYLNGSRWPRSTDEIGRAAVEAALVLLAKRGGPDFRLYKPGLIARRMSHRRQKLGYPSSEAYVAALHGDAAEIDALRQDLMISVTSTFRDPGMWEALAQEVVKPMVDGLDALGAQGAPGGRSRTLRVWVAACATGEEAYSVAMILAQECHNRGKGLDFQVIGTDVDELAIASARSGRLTDAAVAGTPVALRERWLAPEVDGVRIVAGLREHVLFGVHDVLGDPPFGSIDILFCRNLLIYLADAGQRTALASFGRALSPGGFLVLGRDEILPEGLAGWRALDGDHRIFRKTGTGLSGPGESRSVGHLGRGGGPSPSRRDGLDAGVADVLSAREFNQSGMDLRSAYESLQCVNEELHTVNEELRLVNSQLDQSLFRERQASSKLHAVIASAVHPLLVVDSDGQLEHFSRSSGQLFRLRAGDEGRPLPDFANDLLWPEFASVVQRCATQGGESVTKEVMDIRGSHWLVIAAPVGGTGRHERKVLITATDISRLRDATRLQAMLDALPQQVAVLDAGGCIEYVNRAWQDFGSANGADPARIDVGVNYLQASAPSGTTSDPFGERASRGVGDVLAGRAARFRMKYPCAGAAGMLWFLLEATSLARPEGGCLVSHTDITDWFNDAGST